MAYFKIGDTDFSGYVGGLTVKTQQKFNSQTNAAGNTVIDRINEKKTVTVSFVPLGDTAVYTLLNTIKTARTNSGYITITFLNPETNTNGTINTWVADTNVSYYTIQSGNVRLKAFTVTFTEL